MKQNRSLPLVSVIVPVYNTGATIMSTIKSIEKQTYKNIEIIVVNDGSTDAQTIDVLKKLSHNCHIINQRNMGLSSARNTGVHSSNGEYIICLDSDDCIDKKYICKAVNKFLSLEQTNVAIIAPFVQAFGISHEQWSVPNYDLEKLKYKNVIPVASAFKKQVWQEVGGYDTSFKGGFEDWDFWLSIVSKKYSWQTLKEPLFYYRRKSSSMITNANQRRIELEKMIIDKHSNIYGSESVESILKKMQAAEYSHTHPNKTVIGQITKIFSRNFLKRFKVIK